MLLFVCDFYIVVYIYVSDLLSSQEYHSLFRLICPDFPFEPVQKTAKYVLVYSVVSCQSCPREFNLLCSGMVECGFPFCTIQVFSHNTIDMTKYAYKY